MRYRSDPARATILALLLAAPVAACSDGATGPGSVRTIESPTLTALGLSWAGSVDVMESFPVQLVGRIALTNPGAETRTLEFGNGCTALLRAYFPQVPTARLVWDQADVADCAAGLHSLDVAPGETVELVSPVVGAETIVGTGPNEEYGISVYARANGKTVELSVGGVDLAVPGR